LLYFSGQAKYFTKQRFSLLNTGFLKQQAGKTGAI